jgi:hypothetical protein
MHRQQELGDYGNPMQMDEQMMGAGSSNFNKMNPVQIGD